MSVFVSLSLHCPSIFIHLFHPVCFLFPPCVCFHLYPSTLTLLELSSPASESVSPLSRLQGPVSPSVVCWYRANILSFSATCWSRKVLQQPQLLRTKWFLQEYSLEISLAINDCVMSSRELLLKELKGIFLVCKDLVLGMWLESQHMPCRVQHVYILNSVKETSC